jgi:hypothetical protein
LVERASSPTDIQGAAGKKQWQDLPALRFFSDNFSMCSSVAAPVIGSINRSCGNFADAVCQCRGSQAANSTAEGWRSWATVVLLIGKEKLIASVNPPTQWSGRAGFFVE